jgi:hypothetical protein
VGRVLIKRDDCNGMLFGGNKTRHNEFLLAAALRHDGRRLSDVAECSNPSTPMVSLHLDELPVEKTEKLSHSRSVL